MQEKGDRVLDLLDAADWKTIGRKLTYFAIWQSKKYTLKSGSPMILPGGKTPEDLAYEAIGKVWKGERSWDPERYPDLLRHLKWIVASDIDHLYKTKEHQLTERLPELFESHPDQILFSNQANVQVKLERTIIPDPEQAMVLRENEALEEKLKSALYSSVKGDEDLELLLLCFEEGIDKPELIAEQTGWDISKVNNVKKRLFRMAQNLNKIVQNNGFSGSIGEESHGHSRK